MVTKISGLRTTASTRSLLSSWGLSALVFLCMPPCSAQNPETPLEPNRPKWGIIDESGNYKIEPKFEENLRTSEGMVLATPYAAENKYFERLKLFLYDIHGNKVIKEPLNEPDSYHSGLMSIKRGEVYGYLDKNGETAIPFRLLSGLEFHGNYAINFLNDHFEIMDKTGKTVWRPGDGGIKSDNDYGLGVITIEDQAIAVKLIKDKPPSFLAWFDQDLIPFQADALPIASCIQNYGYLDRQGKVAIAPTFISATNFAGGFAQVQRENQHLIIDTKGATKIKLPPGALLRQHGQPLIVITTSPAILGLHRDLSALLPRKIGALDLNGNTLIPAEYEYLSIGGNSPLILACKNTDNGQKYGYIDTNGIVRIPFKFDKAMDFSDGYAPVAIIEAQTATSSKPSTESCASPTIEQLRELDNAIRSQLKAASRDIVITNPLRIMVALQVDGSSNFKLLKGAASQTSHLDLSKRLSALSPVRRPQSLSNSGALLEYIALSNGNVIGPGEPGDPFKDARAKLREQNIPQRFTYYFASTEKQIESLENQADLELSLSDGRIDGSSTILELVRLYCTQGNFEKAEALANKINQADPEYGFDLLMLVYSRSQNNQKLLALLDRQYQKRLRQYSKFEAYDDLLSMGNIYYRMGLMSKAENFYKSAASATDNKVATTDAFSEPVRQVPLDAMYNYACFLADRGRIRESAVWIRKCFTILQERPPGLSPRIVQGRFDNFSTYLTIIGRKDKALFDEFKAKADRLYPSAAKYGLIDMSGKQLTAAAFEKISPFVDGLCVAKDPVSHNCGYIDRKGNWVIPAKFYEASLFYKGIALAAVRDQILPISEYGYERPFSLIDKTGKVLKSLDVTMPIALSKELFLTRSSGKTSICDLTGKPLYTGRINVTDPIPLIESVSSIQVFQSIGIEDSGCTPQEIGVPIRFEILTSSLPEDAQKQISTSKCASPKMLSQVFPTPYRTEDQSPERFGYKDETGAVVLPAKFLKAGVFCEGIAAVQSEMTGKYSYIDTTGKPAFDASFDYANDFADGVAVVHKSNHAYLIDRNGKILSDKYSNILRLPGGCYQVIDSENRSGLMTRSGQLMIAPKYQSIRQFSDGLAAFYNGSEWGFINERGVEVIPPKYAEVGDFSEGVTFYRNEQ
ncbi:MAG: WG repeat-containing protein [Candidatus Obscuribacter sp.]|nr:WG repeat-containing protein [Candidatus Obscuribacter sp.]MBK9280965.1 WG repeat-containing protein [Candidatus Obscuribacter sp.]MBL8084697.1 WG repeat-containing protein [Candidatus Obscuribacter sp.]